jgi:hypothetical protein
MIYDAAKQKVQSGVQVQYTSDVAQAIMPAATALLRSPGAGFRRQRGSRRSWYDGKYRARPRGSTAALSRAEEYAFRA